MTLKGKGAIYKGSRGAYFIYIPQSVARDSAFPFRIPEGKSKIAVMVHVNTVQKLLIVTEYEEKAENIEGGEK